MKTIILQTLAPFNKVLTNSVGRKPCAARRGFLLIPLILVSFALCQQVQGAIDGPKQSASNTAQQSAPGTPEVLSAPDNPDPGGTLPLSNTADGAGALLSITTGFYNSAFGFDALLLNADASFNTGIGAGALLLNNASNNTAVGAGALLNNTASNNTAVGTFALFTHATGVENTAVGFNALLNDTSSNDNTAVGDIAMLNNVDGSSNTAIGVAALRDNVSGANNCALGRGALRFNEGSGNIAIGREAGTTPPLSGQYNNTILLGILGDGDANDPDGRAYIGNVRDVTTGNFDAIAVLIDSTGQLGTVSSSRRFKKDIKPMDQTSEAILALKPVTFHYKGGDAKKAQEIPQYGLIAEDVAAVNPDLIVRDKDGKIYSVRYDAVNVMLLNEFLKEHKKVEAQQTNISQLNSNVANQAAIIAQQQRGMEVLTAQLKEQAAQIQKVSAQLEVNKSAAQVVSYGQ